MRNDIDRTPSGFFEVLDSSQARPTSVELKSWRASALGSLNTNLASAPRAVRSRPLAAQAFVAKRSFKETEALECKSFNCIVDQLRCFNVGLRDDIKVK